MAAVSVAGSASLPSSINDVTAKAAKSGAGIVSSTALTPAGDLARTPARAPDCRRSQRDRRDQREAHFLTPGRATAMAAITAATPRLPGHRRSEAAVAPPAATARTAIDRVGHDSAASPMKRTGKTASAEERTALRGGTQQPDGGSGLPGEIEGHSRQQEDLRPVG